jgi:hypothetical protein
MRWKKGSEAILPSPLSNHHRTPVGSTALHCTHYSHKNYKSTPDLKSRLHVDSFLNHSPSPYFASRTASGADCDINPAILLRRPARPQPHLDIVRNPSAAWINEAFSTATIRGRGRRAFLVFWINSCSLRAN